MNLESTKIEEIVKQVIANMATSTSNAAPASHKNTNGSIPRVQAKL